MFELSDELKKESLQMMNLGFDCFNDGANNPFFKVLLKSGKGHMVDLQTTGNDDPKALVDTGKKAIIEMDEARLYVIVWDGYVYDADGRKWDAVCVEAAERGGPAFLFTQRYRILSSGPLKRIGLPEYVGEAEHLWDSAK